MRAAPETSRALAGAVEMRRAVAETRSERVSRTVARLVAKDIADRALEPGTLLASEVEMAKQFGVGRASIREGLRILEAQGLITLRQGLGGGPRVRRPAGADFGETLALYLQSWDVRVREVMEATVELEGMAASILARKVAAGESIDLSLLIDDDGDNAESGQDAIESAIGWHDRLRQMCDNSILDLTGSAVAHLMNTRVLSQFPEAWAIEQRDMFQQEHAKIAAAIAAGEASLAASLAREHMAEVGRILLEANPNAPAERIVWR